jgi:hypothetical protein
LTPTFIFIRLASQNLQPANDPSRAFFGSFCVKLAFGAERGRAQGFMLVTVGKPPRQRTVRPASMQQERVAMPHDPHADPFPGSAPPGSMAATDRGPAFSGEMAAPVAARGEQPMPLFLFKELTKVFSQWI